MHHEEHGIDLVDLDDFEGEKHAPLFVIPWRKEQIRSDLVRAIRPQLGDERVIYWAERMTVSDYHPSHIHIFHKPRVLLNILEPHLRLLPHQALDQISRLSGFVLVYRHAD
jgi:hypothetical protein